MSMLTICWQNGLDWMADLRSSGRWRGRWRHPEVEAMAGRAAMTAITLRPQRRTAWSGRGYGAGYITPDTGRLNIGSIRGDLDSALWWPQR